MDVESDVLDAARYLREVRPIDPAEVVDYVAADTSEASVRAVLREHATELGLVERADGRFSPPDEGSLPPQDDPVGALPPRLCRAVESILVDRYGADWSEGSTGAALRAAVDDLKRRYLEGGSVGYDGSDVAAYLLYHLPRTYAATRYTLDTLLEAGSVGYDLRVLDVGGGVGASLAGVVDAVPVDALVRYDLVEPSVLADAVEALAGSYAGRNVHVDVRRSAFEAYEPAADYDVVLLANVLSELDDPAGSVRRCLDAVGPDGSVVLIAPADPRTSVQLRRVERAVSPPATVFAPTLRLWPDRRPSDECWSFVEHDPVSIPPFQRALADGADPAEADRYVNPAVRYAYGILRRDGRRRYDVVGDPAAARPLGDLEGTVGDRLDALVVKLSGDLSEGTDRPLFRVGDGSQRVGCFAVVVEPTGLNAAVADAPYGSVLSLRRVLVLWNDDEGAFNLVVDGEATAERVAP